MAEPSSSTPQAPQASQSQTTTKALSLEDILFQLGPITGIQFDPFQPEPKQLPRAQLPSSFPQNPHPFDYFSLFFTPDLFQTITTNTNRYASQQRLHIPEEKQWARE
jgi:hypothetical protein